MQPATRDLWEKQDQHKGDRLRLFTAVRNAIAATSVLYPGSYVDIAASCVWPAVTYVDSDNRARKFFDDASGVLEIIATHPSAPENPLVTFIPGDYATDLGLPNGGFDLLVSLYAGFVSRHCTGYLRVGGHLLVNPSHGDAALASMDDRYELAGVVRSGSGGYSVSQTDLDSYLLPKRSQEVTPELVERTMRGVAYTRSPFAYVFERIR